MRTIKKEPACVLRNFALDVRDKYPGLYVVLYPLFVIVFITVGLMGLFLILAGCAGERMWGWVGFNYYKNRKSVVEPSPKLRHHSAQTHD